ncbi:hypothetical protein [Variovorax paradoxus]|nr:hypothetical protein [Variovorax paradoxus]
MSGPRFGCRRVLVMLEREGREVGKKPVYRLYRLERLQLRMKVTRRKRIALLRGKRTPHKPSRRHRCIGTPRSLKHDKRCSPSAMISERCVCCDRLRSPILATGNHAAWI